MKFAQSAILISFLTVFFLGNIGVNVFKHICKEDGVSISYVYNQGEEHCGEHTHESDLPPCCQAPVEDEKDDCCDDEVYYYKLQLDAEGHASFAYQLTALCAEQPEIYWAEEPLEVADPGAFSAFEDPPPRSGREILIQKQVWNL